MNPVEIKQILNEYALENRRTSWYHFIFLITIWTLIASITLLCNNNIVVLILSIILGFLNVRLFIMYHDYSHGCFLRRSKPIKYFFTIFGIYMLAPKSIWNRSHNFHHANNSKLNNKQYGEYPIMTVDEYSSASKHEKIIYNIQRHPLTIIFGHFSMFVINFCILPLSSKKKNHPDSLISILIYISTISLLIYTNKTNTLILYIIPLFVSHCIGSLLFYLQHNFTHALLQPQETWNYQKAAIESSSFLSMSPILNWISGNIGYHHIHHLNSMIPFYNLPLAHQEISRHVEIRPLHLNWKNIISCLKLRAYDIESNKFLNAIQISEITK